MQKILVWDWPVRLGHWLMAGAFGLAWLTAESESWRLVHVAAGGTVAAIALFRILWGIVGSRHARFTAFVRGPRAVIAYLRSLIGFDPEHHTGHNPAGGWAILALLVLAVATAIAGWCNYNEIGGDLFEEVHEGLAAGMLFVVVVHLVGVFSGSLMHGENLVWAMLDGRKQGHPEEALPSARPFAAVALLVWVAAAIVWASRW